MDSGEIFDSLNKDIAEYSNHGKIILSGDFNCRTGEHADHIINDTLFNRADNNILPETYTCDKELVRKNCDKTINSQGKLLLETCIGTKLRILNGRFLGDSLGSCTYFDVRGGCSVIDYIIVSEDIFHYISYFNVLPPVETSGHCIIRMALNINTPIVNHDNEYLNMEFLPGNFVWDNNSHEKYTNDISSPQAISKLANVMADVDTGGITDINQMTKQFTDIIIDTATSCVKYKLNKKLKNKHKRKQEWFSNNCELMRKDVRL